MSAELIGRARDVAAYQTYGDIDNLLRDLADALEAAEVKIQHALGVLYAASIPLGMTEAMFYQSLMREARGILLERGDES